MIIIIFKNAFMTHETVLFTQGGNVPQESSIALLVLNDVCLAPRLPTRRVFHCKDSK